jgi:hypothetical protein
MHNELWLARKEFAHPLWPFCAQAVVDRLKARSVRHSPADGARAEKPAASIDGFSGNADDLVSWMEHTQRPQRDQKAMGDDREDWRVPIHAPGTPATNALRHDPSPQREPQDTHS